MRLLHRRPDGVEARALARLMTLPAHATVAGMGAGDGRFTVALAGELMAAGCQHERMVRPFSRES